ncbi:MAG: hypothetical protein ACMZI0_18355 [Symbiopectobacterium sp.]|uniref:hypothetical protein n=1 Tax=Symbiopectobacterium sp. TaxID=2952789 RepID=UPI0039ED46A1
MLAKINEMRDSLAVIFYALVKNEKLTTAGNNVEADHEVLRLSAAVEDLEKKFLIPIQHHNVSTSSVIAGGKKTKQMYYMMDEGVIRALQTEPDTVFRKQEKELAVSEWQRKSKQTKKLINEQWRAHRSFDHANQKRIRRQITQRRGISRIRSEIPLHPR